MLTFLLTAALGAYLSRRVNFISDKGLADVAVNYQRIWADAIAFFTLIGFVCHWAIKQGRNTRTYFDADIVPWLSDFGVSVSLPTISLPALPVSTVKQEV